MAQHPSSEAPDTPNWVAHCKVCKAQWVSYAFAAGEKEACHFCGAPEWQVHYTNEAPRYRRLEPGRGGF